MQTNKKSLQNLQGGAKSKEQKNVHLLPSGLYRRFRNHTGSTHYTGLADCYRRWGIAPRPEDFKSIITFGVDLSRFIFYNMI